MTRCSSFSDLATRISNADKTLGAVTAPRAGATSRNPFGAAKGRKGWGRSRPRQCFVRVLLQWLYGTHVADGALLVRCRALNGNLNGVLKLSIVRAERFVEFGARGIYLRRIEVVDHNAQREMPEIVALDLKLLDALA